MIKVRYSIDNKRCHFIIKGHANYKERQLIDKFDVVCAMVSVLGQSAEVGCKKFCKGISSTVQDGNIEIHFYKDNAKARAIVESCVIGIEQVRLQYPQCFE